MFYKIQRIRKVKKIINMLEKIKQQIQHLEIREFTFTHK
jgi:hypothetical protein